MKMIKALLALTLITWGVSAHAVPVGVNFRGEITSISNNANPDLLGAGVTGQAFFSATGVGTEVLSPDFGHLILSFVVNAFPGTFAIESDDIDFPDFPTLTLRNGRFRNINFLGDNGAVTWRVRGRNPTFRIEDTDGNRVRGRFNVQMIPEPGTLALLGIGLLGFAVARRKA